MSMYVGSAGIFSFILNLCIRWQ